MTEPDLWLLTEYVEGFVNLPREGHWTCATIQDDYYNPVLICKTRQELVDFLGDELVTWNGDTATVELVNWRGESKGTAIYYAIPVQLGKIIAY